MTGGAVKRTWSASGTPTGSVSFYDGGGSCPGSSALAANIALDGSGQASTPALSSVGVGAHSIRACYTPTGSFGASTSTVGQTVSMASTATQLSSSVNPAPQGQTVTFTAQVTSAFATVGSGSVLFGDGGSCPTPTVSLGTNSVNLSGAATFSKKNLTVGTHAIVACYQGTTTFGPSASAPLSQQITSTK